MTRIALAIAMLFALGAALVLPAQPAQAAPAAQEARPVIAQPEPDATVRGVVQILGTATHPQFQRYELYYAPFPVRSDQSWVFIGPDAHFQQQPLGMLGTWDSRAVPDGSYALRVRVVKADANYIDSEPRRVTVANKGPEPTATPAQSPTPGEPTGTPAPTLAPANPAAGATVVVAGPTIAAPGLVVRTTTPTSTAKPGASPTATRSSVISSSSGGQGDSGLGELLDVEYLGDVARTAAVYTAGVFVIVGLFFGVKALLLWLWQRARP